MAQSGFHVVNKETIFEVCEKLTSQGTAPSFTTIKKAFGGRGNNATISQYFKEWKEMQEHLNTGNRENFDDMRTAVHLMMSALEQTFRKVARDEFQNLSAASPDTPVISASATPDTDSKLTDLESKLAEANATNSELAEMLDRFRKDNEALAAQNASLATAVENAEKAAPPAEDPVSDESSNEITTPDPIGDTAASAEESTTVDSGPVDIDFDATAAKASAAISDADANEPAVEVDDEVEAEEVHSSDIAISDISMAMDSNSGESEIDFSALESELSGSTDDVAEEAPAEQSADNEEQEEPVRVRPARSQSFPGMV